MTAKVLQLVNSAFFGLLQKITTVRAAVGHLGLDVLKQLVLSVEVFRTFHPKRRIEGFNLEALQNHSRLAAGIASRLPAKRRVSAEAVVAALLHDTGKLVLAAHVPEQFEQVLQQAHRENRSLLAVEHEITGTGHAEIGAYLLALWGLPMPIVDAVCRHHRPERALDAEPGLDVLAVTHIADGLAYELVKDTACEADGEGLLNLDYLAALGVAEELPGWRQLAAEVAQPAPV
jgi:HD-like signal output (HDOD) protein